MSIERSGSCAYNQYINNENQFHFVVQKGETMHMKKPTWVRHSILSLALLAIGAVAAGCTSSAPSGADSVSTPSGEPSTSNPTSPPGTGSTAAETAPKTLNVQHSLGSSVIPAEPKRIAITHQIIMDWLLPLGFQASVSPMAGPDLDFVPYLPQEQQQKLKLIGPPGNPNPEVLLAESPDVIFINWGHEKAYDQLSKIAPSIFVASKDNWRELFRDYARMLQKESEAEQWLNKYQQQADQIKAALPADLKEQTVVFVRFLPKELRVYSNHPLTSVGGVLYHDLGLKPPAGLSTDKQYEAVSLEGLVDMNPDHMFMQIGFIPESDEDARKRYEEITQGALWKHISAVSNGRVYPVDNHFFTNSPLGKQYAVETVTEHLGIPAK